MSKRETMKLLEELKRSLNKPGAFTAEEEVVPLPPEGIFVHELPELLDYASADHDIVGKNGNLYRVDARSNPGYRLDAYHTEPHEMLSAALEAGEGIQVTKGSGKVTIAAVAPPEGPVEVTADAIHACIDQTGDVQSTLAEDKLKLTISQAELANHMYMNGEDTNILTAGTGISISKLNDQITITSTVTPGEGGGEVSPVLLERLDYLEGNATKAYTHVNLAKEDSHLDGIKLIHITNTNARFIRINEYWNGRYPDYAKFTDADGTVWGLVITEHVDASWLGAVGDGVVDCTVPLRQTLELSRLFGKTAYLPSTDIHYRVTAEVIGKTPAGVEFRGKIIGDETMPEFEPVLTIAGNSYREDLSNKMYIYGVDRKDEKILSPCLRLIGLKTWHIEIGLSRKIELMGMTGESFENKYMSEDLGLKSIRSSGYNQIHIGRAHRLELVNDADECWVNENTFTLNRLFGGQDCGIFLKGPYENNHNLFTRGCMEGEFIIEIQNGSSNRFKEVRLERYPDRDEKLKIYFGTNTWDNTVESTWQSYPGIWNGPYESNGAFVEVEDHGILNAVHASEQIDTVDYPILELTKTSNMSSTGSLTSYSNVYNLTQNLSGRFNVAANWKLIYSNLSKPIPVKVGDAFSLQSDATIWRYSVVCFDSAGKVINVEPPEFIRKGNWNWDASLGGFSPGNASIANTQFCVGNTSSVKSIAFVIRASNDAAGTWFDELRITRRASRKPTYSAIDSEICYSENNQRRNMMSVDSLGSVNWMYVRPDVGVYCDGKIVSKSWERVCPTVNAYGEGATEIQILSYQPVPTEDLLHRRVCISGMGGYYAVAGMSHDGLITTITLRTGLTADVPAGTIVSLFPLITVETEAPEPVSPAAPTKFYILPLGGQSNMTGFGELMPELPVINPRLKQLGYVDSHKDTENTWAANRFNVKPEHTIYGDRFDEFRPMADSNLKLIPSSYCLDNHHNLMAMLCYAASGGNDRPGGLVGTGHYLAEKLLQYIPEDYGIIIVDGSRGSTGFGDENELGTYDTDAMRASDTARRWGVDTPFGNQFYDRVTHALNLNSENKLLPVIWFLGESDDNANDHYDRFKAYVKWFRDTLATGGLGTRVPSGNAQDFRWFCMSSTKILFGEDQLGKDHLTRNFDYDHSWSYIRANYDNYAFLMEDPEFIQGANKESQIISARIDIDQNGDFFETALEELADRGIPSSASSQADWHFSTAVLMYQQPAYLINLLASYGKCINAPMPSKWSRPVRGNTGTVITDNVVFQYEKTLDYTFDPSVDCKVHIDFPTATANVAEGITYTAPSAEDYEDEVVGTVKDFDGTNAKRGILDFGAYAGDYTISSYFKFKVGNRATTQAVIGCSASTDKATPFIGLVNQSLVVSESTSSADKGCVLNKSYLGAWKGQFTDWQHVTIVYKASMKIIDVYLNGCLVETITNCSGSKGLKSVCIGSFASPGALFGYVANVRVYQKTLNKEQVAMLYRLDTVN